MHHRAMTTGSSSCRRRKRGNEAGTRDNEPRRAEDEIPFVSQASGVQNGQSSDVLRAHMPSVSSLSIAHHMPVITAAPCEPVSQRSTNVRLNAALPLTFVVEKANKTRNNTTHTPTLPLAIPVTTTVDGVSVVENPPGLSTEQEAGVIIGCLLLLIIIGVLLYVYCHRRYGKGSDRPILSRTPSPPPDTWNGYGRWSSSSPTYPPSHPGDLDYPVVDNQSNVYRNAAEQGGQEPEELGMPEGAPGTELPAQVPSMDAPQTESAPPVNFNSGSTHPEVPQEPAYTQERGYQNPNTRIPTGEDSGGQPYEEQPPKIQNPVPPELPVHPIPEQNGIEQAAVNNEAPNAHQAAADSNVQSPVFQEKEPPPPPPRSTTEQPPPPPPPAQSPPVEPAARHVTFAEPDAEQKATKEAVASQEEPRNAAQAQEAQTRSQELAQEQNNRRGQAGQQVEEQTLAETSKGKTPRKQAQKKKEKGSNPSEVPYRPKFTSATSEIHRIGDEQARRLVGENPRRVAPPAPPMETQPLVSGLPSPPPPYVDPSMASWPHIRTPHGSPTRADPFAGAHDSAELGTPEERENAEIQGIHEALAHVRNGQAQAVDFQEWDSGVTFYINQIEWRATYIQTMNEHHAPQRAERLNNAAGAIRACRDDLRYFQQTAAAPPQVTQEVGLEERKPPSSPKREKSDKKTSGFGWRIIGAFAPTSRSRRPSPRRTVPDKKKKKKDKQIGLGASNATQATAQEAATGPSEVYTGFPPQGVQYMGQNGDAARQSDGTAGQQLGSGPVGTSGERGPVQRQESPPLPMPGAYDTVEEEEEVRQNQAEATGTQSADGANQQQQGDQGVEPQGTQEEAEVTVQYPDGVAVIHEAESHEREGDDGNRNG